MSMNSAQQCNFYIFLKEEEEIIKLCLFHLKISPDCIFLLIILGIKDFINMKNSGVLC